MSAWPCVILGPVSIAWGNLAAGGYTVTYPARQVLDIVPGSALEAAVGTARFRRIADAERGQGDCLDRSATSN
jgi:hypothetical protein